MSWAVEAEKSRLALESQQRKQSAWLMAALTRTKKLPAFESFVGIDAKPEKRKQTWQEMRAALRAIAGPNVEHG